MSKMTNTDLLAIIRAHRRDSLGVEDGELSTDRASALDHYHGRPYGNEQEGRSAVVSRDLSEAVDWAMPAIMDVFTQSGALGEFDPVGPEDEDAAKQESDYVNQVIMKDNPGFLMLHDAVKDTLILRNGYVKHSWDVATKIVEDEYTGLTMEEITRMTGQMEAKGGTVEITSATEGRTIVLETPMGPQPVEVFDLTVKCTTKKGKVRIEAVPSEEVRVSKRCRGTLQESPFTEHVTTRTRSDLLEMGMPRDFVDDLAAHNERDNSSQARARDSASDESDSTTSAINDRSMDEIEYCEAYLRVDWDGDGIAELRKVVTVGDQIPPGKDWNEPISAVPMTGFMAKRMPHRHVGESLDDALSDLQEIKTVLMRQLLDNIYLTNNNQWLVNERVNLTDFLQSLPGGVKRVTGMEPVSGSAESISSAPIVDMILPVVDYIDGMKEGRTGISKASTGMDPDTLKQSTKGAFMENLNRASQMLAMMARMLAETGVKELVLQVHALLLKHQDKARVVQMRGKWVTVNPQEWQERTDLIPRVGLGTGNEEEKRQKLLLVSELQDKLAQQGMVGPKQAYALFSELAETLGFDMPEKFAMSPDSPEYQQMMQERQSQPAPPNPLAEAEEIKGKYALQMKEVTEKYKQECDDRDRMSRETIKAAELEMQALLAQQKVDLGMAGFGAGLQQPSPGPMPPQMPPQPPAPPPMPQQPQGAM